MEAVQQEAQAETMMEVEHVEEMRDVMEVEEQVQDFNTGFGFF